MIFNQMYIFYYLLSIFFKDSCRQLHMWARVGFFCGMFATTKQHITLNEYLISSPENLTSFHKLASLTISCSNTLQSSSFQGEYSSAVWHDQQPDELWHNKKHHWPAKVPPKKRSQSRKFEHVW